MRLLIIIKHQTVNSQNYAIVETKSVVANKIWLRQLFVTRD